MLGLIREAHPFFHLGGDDGPISSPLDQQNDTAEVQENIQADPHSPGSALPASAYAADIGYLVDGTPWLCSRKNVGIGFLCRIFGSLTEIVRWFVFDG